MGELEENKKLLLLNAKLLKKNTALKKTAVRLNNLMYDLMEKLHSEGFK